MIKSLSITNHLGDTIELELTRPEKSGFIIKGIEGLGPAKANVNTTVVATNDGAFYNSARLSQRDIVITLEFLQNPNESIEDIRHKSYKYFPIKRNIRMLVKTDRRELETVGYVEANEPSIFSSQEGCSITIQCPDPFFYSSIINETIFSGVEAMFEFPFENVSLDEPLLEMGMVQNKVEEVVYNSGDSDVGVTITIHAIGEASNVTIYNITTDEKMRIDTTKLASLTGSGIIAGDTITIETKRGDKHITLLRDGEQTNIINCLDKGTDWFTLLVGDNVFVYTAETGNDNLQFRIANKIVYDGV